MKTIKKGKNLKSKSTWYIGKKLDCHRCGFQAELEKEDIPQNRIGEFLFQSIQHECPNCGGRIFVMNPNWRPDSVDLLEGNALALISAFNAVCKNPKNSEKCVDFLEILYKLSAEYSGNSGDKVVEALTEELAK